MIYVVQNRATITKVLELVVEADSHEEAIEKFMSTDFTRGDEVEEDEEWDEPGVVEEYETWEQAEEDGYIMGDDQ